MKFAVQLKGSKPLLEQMAPGFQGEFVKINKIGDEWFLESSAFNTCQAPLEVFPIADEVLRLVHRIIAMYCQLFSPFEVGYVQSFTDDGSPGERGIRGVTRIQIYSATEVPELQAISNGQSLGSKLVATAMSDKRLEEALNLIGDGVEFQWPQIYNVIEFLGGSSEIAKKKWATAEQIRKCRQTANHYRHLGSPKRYPLPINPPSQGEATRFALTLLKRWILSSI